jgi:hypothetical protein
LVDPDGKELFKREFADDQASAPRWLVRMVAFPRTELSREITDGWNILGTLYIEGHRGYAYAYLWRALQSQLWILGIGLPVAIILVSILGHFLLRPLRRAIRRVALLSENHLPAVLPGSALHELNALSCSVNQLIQEKHRNYVRRKLKLLSWRQGLAGHLQDSIRMMSTANCRFVSTQGNMVLYRRLPVAMAVLNSWRQRPNTDPSRTWLEFQQLWPQALAEPMLTLPIPLLLLEDPWWSQLRTLLRASSRRQLEWQVTDAVLSPQCIERLAELSQLGMTHCLGHFVANPQSFFLLEQIRPKWVICPWVSELPPAYWILHNVTVHDLGAGVLLDTEQELSSLLELEFNGYPQREREDEHVQ